MSVNLKKFVDIDIQPRKRSAPIATRKIIVLLTSEETTLSSTDPILVHSYSEAQTACALMTNTLAYLKVYFDNGGIDALVYPGLIPDSEQTVQTLLTSVIADLDDELIVVAYAPADGEADPYTTLKSIALIREEASTTIHGTNEKIILARTTSSDSASVKNFAVKYSTIIGAEMTMAAYLSQVNVYGTDSVYDYMFTKETLTAEDISTTQYETIIANNMNVALMLGNTVRNCGGDCKDGYDLVNTYCRIILCQTLTTVALDLLTQKIKNSSGISKLYSVLSEELVKYVTSGYLTTDKIWSYDDLTITYNSQTFTIIEKGTALEAGYLIKILPYESLSEVDKASHKTPPIYVIIADQYSIRMIEIDGEVL